MVAVYLRELEEVDLPFLTEWRNDPELANRLASPFLFIAPAVDKDWYNKYLHSRANNVRLAIVLEETKEIIGATYLTSIHWVNRSAEFSIMIGNKSYWGAGIGTRIVSEVIRHAFKDLNLVRVYSHVLSSNRSSIAMFSKNSFVLEGTLRKAIFKNGEYHDIQVMSRLASDSVMK